MSAPRLVFRAVLVLLLLAGAGLFWFNRLAAQRILDSGDAAGSTALTLEQPTALCFVGDASLAVLDRGGRRVLVLDPAGRVEGVFFPELPLFAITGGPDGSLLGVREGLEANSVELVHFARLDAEPRLVRSFAHARDSIDRPLTRLHFRDGYLTHDLRSDTSISILRTDLAGSPSTPVAVLETGRYNLFSWTGTGAGFRALSFDGDQLYRGTESRGGVLALERMVLVPRNSRIPLMRYGNEIHQQKNRYLVNDLLNRCIYRFDADGYYEIFAAADTVPEWLPLSLAVHDQGYCAVLDQRHAAILLLDANGKLLSSTSNFYLIEPLRSGQIAAIAGLSITLAAAMVLAGMGLRSLWRRLNTAGPLDALHKAVIIGLICIAVMVPAGAAVLQNHHNRQLLLMQQDKLRAAASVIARQIPLGNEAAIQKPGNLDSPAWNSLHKALAPGPHATWNIGFETYLLRRQSGSWYILADGDGSWGCMYPLHPDTYLDRLASGSPDAETFALHKPSLTLRAAVLLRDGDQPVAALVAQPAAQPSFGELPLRLALCAVLVYLGLCVLLLAARKEKV